MPDIDLETGLRARIDELLDGRRRDFGRIALAVGGVVVIALFLWGRGATARIAPPAAVPGGASGAPVPTPTPAVFVDVAGAVRVPGLYTLPLGARVADALAAARGPPPRADLSTLNLAQIVTDGSKIVVPGRGEGGHETADGAATGAPIAATAPALVSLNAADQAALETVPGIGPVTALAIIGYRERVGGFTAVDELLEIDGIGPATLEQIRPYVQV